MVCREEGGGGVKEKGEKNQNTALKRKKKNGSPEKEACGVGGMAKAGIKREHKGAQRVCTYEEA